MTAKHWFIDRKFYMRVGGGATNPSRHSPLTLSLLIAMVGILGIDLARADPNEPTVQLRERAALACPEYPPDPNIPNKRGWEPAVAAGPDNVVTVFHIKDTGVGYAVYDTLAQQWVDQGTIDTANYPTAHDPAIAYNSQTGGFVASARTARAVLTSSFDPSTNQFGPWVERVGTNTPAKGYDKPWIVAGEMTPSVQEFYVTYWSPHGYLRSTDGGNEWVVGLMIDSNTGEPVTGCFCPQPAVYQDGPLYVAYVKAISGNYYIRFLVGEDIDDPNDPNCGGVRFTHLYGITSPLGGPVPPVRLTVPLNHNWFEDYLPGRFETLLIPQLAVDPTNPDRLYIVYHDTATAASSDVNVYLRVLTRSGSWTAGPRIRVNNDVDPSGAYDQFMPSVTVDIEGRIHVMFYDDRNYTQQDNQTNPPPKFDVFYAWSPDQATTWFNEELFANDPAEPALDWALANTRPHEYNGIAWYGNSVWTTYTGTWSQDQQTNKAVISSSRIDW